MSSSFYSLPLVDKTIAEHYLDRCSFLKIDNVQLLDYEYNTSLAETIGSGEKWGITVSYHGDSIQKDIGSLQKKNLSFMGEDERTLLIYGAILPLITTDDFKNFTEVIDNDKCSLPGIYMLSAKKIYYNPKLEYISLASLDDFFDANFRLLQDPSTQYILPNYSSESGIYIGRNCGILPNVTITPSILLGDNALIGRNCELYGPVIIGNNVIINQNNIFHHSIVMPYSFIGNNMEFRNKIIYFSRIIDVPTGTYIDIIEKHVTQNLSRLKTKFDFFKIWEYLLALFLIFPLAGIFVIDKLTFSKLHSFAKRCSVETLPILWKVLKFQADLILRESTEKEAAFTYSKSLGNQPNKYQINIDNKYYEYNRNCSLIFLTVVRNIFHRWSKK